MPSYVLLWNPKEWPHAKILRMISNFRKSGSAKEPWRFMSHKAGKAGDDAGTIEGGPRQRLVEMR